jgi:uncharacterized membrane protein YkvA (DUF1232 family)
MRHYSCLFYKKILKKFQLNVNKQGRDKSKRATESKSFAKAKNKTEEYINDDKKLSHLIGAATKKANGISGPFTEIRTSVLAVFRLIKSYAKGAYTTIPWQSLVMLVASVVYFVMPVDFIPDFIVGLGFAEDAAILGWTIKTFESGIDDFIEWEEKLAQS